MINNTIPRFLAVSGLFVLLGAYSGCGAAESIVVAQPPELLAPPRARVSPATYSSIAPQFPQQPTDPADAVEALRAFVNANDDPRQIGKLIAAWEHQWISSSQEQEFMTGTVVETADIDGDNQKELLIVLPGAQLVVLDPATDKTYQASTYQFRDLLARIWRIADINNDGRIEIAAQAASCGAHTCSLTVNVLHWAPKGYTDLLIWTPEDNSAFPGVTMPSATATWRKSAAGAEQELVLQGGLLNSEGVGAQREYTEVYAWNGSEYRLKEHSYDPVASQHPYFKFIDGNQAFVDGNYQLAIERYLASITTPYPGNDSLGDAGLENAGPIIAAAARFQLMLTYLQLGNDERATATYRQSQQRDGDYASWSQAFWQVYLDQNDIAAGCAAATEAAQKAYLPGSGYTTTPLSTLICPQIEWQAEHENSQ
ncbi:MAG: hypothetical protein MI924_08010 [Chloroflexales bacterium]|nr:hypothetical protein [Chloroflexales bacterium]